MHKNIFSTSSLQTCPPVLMTF